MRDSSEPLGGPTTKWWPLVLSAAAQIVSENGVASLDIYQVAERSGVSRQTLYRAVGSNDGLVREIIHSTRAVMDQLIEEAALAENVPQYVSLMLEACRKFAAESPEFAVLYMGLASDMGGSLSAYASFQLEDAMALVLVNLIEDGKRRGAICVDTHPGVTAWMIDNLVSMYLFSLVSGYHRERLTSFLGDATLSPTQIDQAIMRFVTAAISAEN